ncbi:MAG: sodium:calcium antiporter [Promethearchaeota archaeon]
MWEILFWLLVFVGGYFTIFFAADVFLDNLKDLCLIFNLSPFIIGLLVLGIDPEESIASIIAAINGLPFIAVGNVIGNSIFSLSLCFALAAFFYRIELKAISKFYFLILYACMIAIIFSFTFQFGLFIFGIITLILYLLYIFKSLKDVSKKGTVEVVEIDEIIEEREKFEFGKVSKFKKVVWVLLSLLFIILGGELLIFSAENIINLTNIAEEFFGFIIIAFVTNVEELTLIFKSIKKKSIEIGLGGMIGKVIWNLSLTYGISAIIAINIQFLLILILNWIILLVLIIFFQFKAYKKEMGKPDAIFLAIILVIFLIINLLSI